MFDPTKHPRGNTRTGHAGQFATKLQSPAEVTLGSRRRDRVAGHRQLVAREILSRIAEGTAPWQRPWRPGRMSILPTNAATGASYSGQNRLWLMIRATQHGWSDSRWMTFNQAKKAGGHVRRGERGERILVYKTFQKRDENGDPVTDDEGRPVTGAFASTATVFNVAQIDGLPEPEETPEPTWDTEAAGDAVIAGSGARIEHHDQDQSYYVPSEDVIRLPNRGQFMSAAGYYSTAFHELSHWTGHQSRLNRRADGGMRFGEHGYAREELVAELSSFLVASETGSGYEPGESSAYLKSWAERRHGDVEAEIMAALGDAGRASKWLLEHRTQEPA